MVTADPNEKPLPEPPPPEPTPEPEPNPDFPYTDPATGVTKREDGTVVYPDGEEQPPLPEPEPQPTKEQ